MKRFLLTLISVINQLLMSTLTVAQIGTGTLSGLVHDKHSSLPIISAKLRVEKVDSEEKLNSGVIQGIIFNGQSCSPLPFANIVLEQDGEFVSGTTSDIDGAYKFEGLKAGLYDVNVSYVGFTLEEKPYTFVLQKDTQIVDIELLGGLSLPEVEIVEYMSPMIFRCGGCGCYWTGYYSLVVDSLIAPEPRIPSLSLYPNPASSQITLNLSELDEEVLSLRILDQHGRLILERKSVLLDKISLSLEELSNGIYIASVQTKKGLISESFIVAK